MIKFSIFLSLLISNTGLSQSIWEPSVHCSTKQFGLWYGCSSEKIESFSPEPITESDLEDLADLPIENTVGYNFKCESSRQFNVTFVMAQHDYPILWNTAGTFHATYSMNEQKNLTYQLNFNPPSTSIAIREGCSLVVLSNLSSPNLKILTYIAKNRKKMLQNLSIISSGLSKESELPARWSALKSAVTTLEDSSTAIDFERSELEKELIDLKSISSNELTKEEQERKEIVPSMIENSVSISLNLRSIKSDIEALLPLAEQCDLENNDAYCFKSVETTIARIKEQEASEHEKSNKLASFLQMESKRLKDYSQRTSEKLLRLSAESSL